MPTLPPAINRLLETLSVGVFLFYWIILPFVGVWIIVAALFTKWWWLVPLYAAWTWWDWDAPKLGSRCLFFHRDLALWRYFAAYFPIRLVKTAELPPDRNYLICNHPHGVLSISCFLTLLTNATGFSEKFPGIQSILITLEGQFWFPFRREVGLWLGGASASHSSLRWLLENPGSGRAIGIVTGGLNESLFSRPGTHHLKLKERMGFCRYSLMHGADLVPLYHFGENEIYEQHLGQDEQRMKNMQARIRESIGFFPPLPKGPSMLGLPSGGILPFRRPVTSVMGAPLRVERVEQPTDEQVKQLHARYCAALVDFFEKHKRDYGVPEDVHITFY